MNLINLEAEQAVIGKILEHNELFEMVELHDFQDPFHKKIFEKMESLSKSKLPINSLTLKDFFVAETGNVSYLIDTIKTASEYFILSFTQTLKILQEIKAKVKLKEIIASTIEEFENGDKTGQEIRNALMDKVESLSFKNDERESVSISQAVNSAFSKENETMVYFGFKNLDEALGGVSLGSFVVLAGRPSMGKSCLAMNLGLQMAKNDDPVLIISLEMGTEQLAKRVISNLASIHLTKLRHNNLTNQHELEAFQRAVGRVEKMPLSLKDEGGMTLAKLRYEIKKFVKKTGGKLVVVDYIQLIKHKTKGGGRVDDVTEITNSLKEMAMEFKIVILGVSQLSRSVESRENKKPQLSDLRDSGSIEQDADVVIFALRPEYYIEREKPLDDFKLAEWQQKMNKYKGVAYAIIAKSRDGECKDVEFRFTGEFQQFVEFTSKN